MAVEEGGRVEVGVRLETIPEWAYTKGRKVMRWVEDIKIVRGEVEGVIGAGWKGEGGRDGEEGSSCDGVNGKHIDSSCPCYSYC